MPNETTPVPLFTDAQLRKHAMDCALIFAPVCRVNGWTLPGQTEAPNLDDMAEYVFRLLQTRLLTDPAANPRCLDNFNVSIPIANTPPDVSMVLTITLKTAEQQRNPAPE